MMISCDDAPTLENELHKRFTRNRVNKVNFRKEFFRVTIGEVAKAVEELHGTVEYEAIPEALQYREIANHVRRRVQYDRKHSRRHNR